MAEATFASRCRAMCHYGRVEDWKQTKALAQEEEAAAGFQSSPRYPSEGLTRSQFVTVR